MAVRQFLQFSKILPAVKNVIPGLTSCPCSVLAQQSHRRQSMKAQQEIVKDFSKIENRSSEIFDKVNQQITEKTHGRLFAVVHIGGLQYKVTTEDIIVVQQAWAPSPGDKIRLEKVLLVGCSDFTLIGRPLLPLDQITIYATVVEKTVSHPKARFRYKPRSNYMKLSFLKEELTYVRITDIILSGKVNALGDTDGLQYRIF